MLPNGVKVDTKVLEGLAQDLEGFADKFKTATDEEAGALAQAIADSYKTTQAKIILNFGKTIVPVYEAELDLLKLTKTNDECNVDCATKCFEPDYDRNNFTFEKACMKKCKCNFKFEEKKGSEINKTVREFEKATGKVAQKLETAGNGFVGGFAPQA